MAKAKDLFVNTAYGSVTQAVTNTLTFSEIQSGISLFDKVAWVIHRVEWTMAETCLHQLSAETDVLQMGVTVSNKVAALELSDPALVTMLELSMQEYGTPANAELVQKPVVQDFTNLPGGGLIIPPKPIYIAISCAGFASVATVHARLYFTHKDLSPADYWELVEARRIVE